MMEEAEWKQKLGGLMTAWSGCKQHLKAVKAGTGDDRDQLLVDLQKAIKTLSNLLLPLLPLLENSVRDSAETALDSEETSSADDNRSLYVRAYLTHLKHILVDVRSMIPKPKPTASSSLLTSSAHVAFWSPLPAVIESKLPQLCDCKHDDANWLKLRLQKQLGGRP